MADSEDASTVKPRRRFIAGAVCPQCQALDRIVIEAQIAQATVEPGNEAGSDQAEAGTRSVSQRRCVACGFVEALPTETTSDANLEDPLKSAQKGIGTRDQLATDASAQTAQVPNFASTDVPAYVPRGRAERRRGSTPDSETVQVVKIVDSSGRSNSEE